jgi:hypothetical protein
LIIKQDYRIYAGSYPYRVANDDYRVWQMNRTELLSYNEQPKTLDHWYERGKIAHMTPPESFLPNMRNFQTISKRIRETLSRQIIKIRAEEKRQRRRDRINKNANGKGEGKR